MDNSIEFIISSTWLILFVIVMLGVFVNMRLVNKYIKLLQSNFPAQWKKINNTGVMVGEMKTQLNFLKFLFHQEYQNLGDATIAEDGKRLRKFFLFYFVICGCFFVVTAILLA